MKILIAGYYGFGNAGDELILSAVLTQLQHRYISPDICVLSANPVETRMSHRVRTVSRWSPFVILRELWANDFLILGGGGLLQNNTSQRSLLYYLALIGMARLLQVPVVLYALGVESISGRVTTRLVKWALSSPDVRITVRDEASKEILSAIGIPPASIHVTADPVFAWGSAPSPKERYSFQTPSVLFIPRFPCSSSGRRVFAVLGRILKDQKKINVRGLLFQPATESPFLDSFEGEAILSEVDFMPVLPVNEIARTIEDFQCVVSARFHGLVLAALAGRPFIGVGDENKVGRLCAAFHMPYLPWDATENQILEAVDELLLRNAPASVDSLSRLRQAALQTADFVG